MVPHFLLKNSHTSPARQAEFGTYFGTWHQWWLRHTPWPAAARGLPAQPGQPHALSGPLHRKGLSEQHGLTMHAPGEQLSATQTALFTTT